MPWVPEAMINCFGSISGERSALTRACVDDNRRPVKNFVATGRRAVAKVYSRRDLFKAATVAPATGDIRYAMAENVPV